MRSVDTLLAMLMAGFLLTLEGCALTPQQVQLKPIVASASAPTPPVGGKRSIALTTADERLSSAIGSRGLNNGMSAEITTRDDVGSVVRGQLESALLARGFEVTTATDPDIRELRVEVRNLEYNVTPGIVTGHLRAEAALKGICSEQGSRKYENLYRGESTEEVFVVQFAEENEKHLNTALGNVILQLLGDQSLFDCLAARE